MIMFMLKQFQETNDSVVSRISLPTILRHYVYKMPSYYVQYWSLIYVVLNFLIALNSGLSLNDDSLSYIDPFATNDISV